MRRGRESFIETMRNSINATPAAAAYVTYFTYSKNGLLVSSKLRRRVKSELSDHISVCVRFLCSLELCMSLIGEFVELSWRLLQPRCSRTRSCPVCLSLSSDERISTSTCLVFCLLPAAALTNIRRSKRFLLRESEL